MLPAYGLGEATTWSGLHDPVFKLCVKMYVFYDICTVWIIRLGHWVPVLCYMGAAEMAFCAACIWPRRGHDMVRSTSTFAVFKWCVKMYVFYDICTVCVISLGHWVPVLCYMGAAEMFFSVLHACGLVEAMTW